MEELPRELVWEVVGRLPVRDVLLGVSLVSRSFRQALLGSAPSQREDKESDEFWRLYALRWSLWSDADGSSSSETPTSWRTFCRQELEGWHFAKDTQLHIDVPLGRLVVGDRSLVPPEKDLSQLEEPRREHMWVVLDQKRKRAELLLHHYRWQSVILLVDRPITSDHGTFHVTNQTGFWMVGVASPLSEQRRTRGLETSYHTTWDTRMSYNVNGTFHIPAKTPETAAGLEMDMGFSQGQEVTVRVEGSTVRFYVDDQLRGKPFDLSNLPRPWHFFWGTDGKDSVATIVPDNARARHQSDNS